MIRNRKLSNIIDKDSQPVTKKNKRKRAKVQCHCSKCKGKLVDFHTKVRHDDKFSSQISTIDTSQEVYEDINTDESSYSILSVKNEALMQNVEWSVDIEEVQDITDGNSY